MIVKEKTIITAIKTLGSICNLDLKSPEKFNIPALPEGIEAVFFTIFTNYLIITFLPIACPGIPFSNMTLKAFLFPCLALTFPLISLLDSVT